MNDVRKQINKIDEQMAKLFEERMTCAKKIGEYKKEHALPIYDESRELELINNNSKFIESDEVREYYVDFLKSTMNISKRYQAKLIEGLKVAYSGVKGAFAYIACTKMFPNATYVAYKDFISAYNAVLNGECDTCVLPLENSYAGEVGNVMDLIFSGPLHVNQVKEIAITQNLVGIKGSKLENIKKVISHEQALNQCKEYLSKKGFVTEEASNTAVAAKMVSEVNDFTLAAIASSDTVELYDLEILEANINSSYNNSTRFGAFTKAPNIDKVTNKMGEYTILVFTVKNEAGALAKTLNIIGSYGYNMRTLRSRPMKDLIWNYYFYVELEGSITNENGIMMLNALKVFCDKLKVVGTYLNN